MDIAASGRMGRFLRTGLAERGFTGMGKMCLTPRKRGLILANNTIYYIVTSPRRRFYVLRQH